MISRLIAEDCKRAGVVVHGGTIMAVLSAFDPEKRPFYHWQVCNGNGYITDIDPEEWKKGVHLFYNVRKFFRFLPQQEKRCRHVPLL